MAKFSTWFQHQQELLEKAIPGIFFFPDKSATYILNGEEKQTPQYVLPTKIIGTTRLGLFFIDGDMQEIALGVRHDTESEVHYHNLLPQGVAAHGISDNNTLYLPLSLLDWKTNVNTIDKQPLEGSPFFVYGLAGTTHRYPVRFLEQSKNKVRSTCFYKDPKGELKDGYKTYDGSFDDILHALRKEAGVDVGGRHRKSSLPTTGAVLDASDKDHDLDPKQINWHDPKSIVTYLNQYVIGQEHAKKAAAVAFSNYMIRKETDNTALPKDCLIFIGPTGSGKTFIMKLLAEAADIPYAKASLSGKSSEGYVGHRLSDVFKQIQNQIQDKSKDDAPYGIIFLDELDKTAVTAESFNRDFGSHLQQEMIGWLEGDKILLTDYSGTQRTESWIDTQNLLFVMAGAFHGPGKEHSLEQIIAKRIGQKKQIGFGAQHGTGTPTDEILSQVQPRDFIDYGLKPELVGRITTRATLHELTVEDKVQIIKESKSSVFKQYTLLLDVRGYALTFDEEVLRVLVEHCPQETGARELTTVCSALFLELLYDPEKYAKEKKIHLTGDIVRCLLEEKSVVHGQREEQHTTTLTAESS